MFKDEQVLLGKNHNSRVHWSLESICSAVCTRIYEYISILVYALLFANSTLD